MLINFSVGNHRSVKDPVQLSMDPGERLKKHSSTNLLSIGSRKFLKNAILFGPNGSGKTNILNSIRNMYTIIKSPTVDVSEEIYYDPHSLCTNCSEQGTFYEIEFFYDSVYYIYEFTNDRTKILKEKLSYSKNRSNYEVHFERDIDKNIFSVPNDLSNLTSKTRDNRLFLSVAQDANDIHCANVIRWFSDELLFFDSNRMRRNISILKEPSIKKKFIKFLNYAGIAVTDIEIRSTTRKISEPFLLYLKSLLDSAKENIEPDLIVDELYLMYDQYDDEGFPADKASISYDNESRGTKKLICIALALLKSNDSQKVLIIDEFDDSLHLGLSQALVKLFNSKSNKTQAILSTHQLELMDEGLRIDQIYLADKNFRGMTTLYSLFDFEEIDRVARSDIKFVKRYLSGQFGAVPYIELEKITSDIFGDD